jgi:hypothetical protein
LILFWAISSCTLYLMPNLGIKDRSIWAKKISAWKKLLITLTDPIFNSIIEKWSANNSRTSTRIETLVLLILEQQVSIDSAKATFKIKGRDKNLRPCCTYGFIGSGI